MIRSAIAVLVISGLTLLPTGVARAGSYDVTACGDMSAPTNNSWDAYNNAEGPGQLEAGNRCSSADEYGGLFARDAMTCGGGCSAVPGAAAAGWRFTAPPGTTITGLSYSRWYFKMDDDDWSPGLAVDGSVV